MKIIPCVLYIFQLNNDINKYKFNQNDQINILIRSIPDEKVGMNEVPLINEETSTNRIQTLYFKKRLLDYLENKNICYLDKYKIIMDNQIDSKYKTNLIAGNLLADWNFDEIK